MPFKIVQTKERGEILLSVVPSRWELDGVLKWPRSGTIKPSTFHSMQQDENSVPSTDWIEVKCRLKRQYPTYDEAKSYSKQMSDQSDTEESDHMPPPASIPLKRKVINREIIGRIPANDYSDVVSEFVNFLICKCIHIKKTTFFSVE